MTTLEKIKQLIGGIGKTMPPIQPLDTNKDGIYSFEDDDAAKSFVKHHKKQSKRRLAQKIALDYKNAIVDNVII